MKSDRLLALFYEYLHTVTIAHTDEPNEPYRKVIFSHEVPKIADAIKAHFKDLVPEEKAINWGAGRTVRKDSIEEDIGYNVCRKEMLKRIEEV